MDVRVTDENVRIIGIEAYDIYGKVVRTIVGTNDAPPTYRINLSGLAAGVYTVRVRTDRGTLTQKIIVQR